MRATETRNDIDQLKRIMERYFKVYDVRWDKEIVAFYCNILNIETIGDRFSELRKEMKKIGYTPLLRYEKGEHTILVMKKPKVNYRSIRANILMLILTLFSTIWTGALYWASRSDWDGEDLIDIFTVLLHPNYVLFGALSFALPLMTILGAHELAHYYAAKKHNVDASLPFFLPVPPIIGVFGTFGAFISMREPIPNKKALIDIGAAGPIAGFLVAIPVTILGLIFSDIYPVAAPQDAENVMYIGIPVIFMTLETIFPIPSGSLMHPTLFAGWVGLFVTGLNLLPCGQLDGGHIARALLGDKSKYLSYLTIASMIGLVYFFPGWFLLAILIIFLGLKHPPPLDDISKLGPKRKVIGVFAIAMLLLCFHPAPLIPAEKLQYDVELYCETPYENISSEEIAIFTISVNNTGDLKDTKNVTAMINLTESTAAIEYWNITLQNNLTNESRKIIDNNRTENISIELEEDKITNLTIIVKPPKNATHDENVTIEIFAVSENKTHKTDNIKIYTTIKQDFGISIETYDGEQSITPDNSTQFFVYINNTGAKNEYIIISLDLLQGEIDNWNLSFLLDSNELFYEGSEITKSIKLSIGESKTALLEIKALNSAEKNEKIEIMLKGDIEDHKNIGVDELILTITVS